METPRPPVTDPTLSAAGSAPSGNRLRAPSGNRSRATTGDPSRTTRPRGSILVRLGWMLAGSLVMLISVMTIASFPSWTFSLRDGVFWGAVVATGALRYWDATHLGGETTSGEPVTAAALHRYLGGLAVFAVFAWVAAQSVQL